MLRNETVDENMLRLATQRVIIEQNQARESSVERSCRLAQQNIQSMMNRTCRPYNFLNSIL